MRKLTRRKIEDKLNNLGWELPKGITYKGMLYVHAVQCTTCGWVQDKRLDNLIYREERCSHCLTHVVSEDKMDKVLQVVTNIQKMVNTIPTIDQAVEWLECAIKVKQGLQITSRNNNPTELKRLFQKLISKTGFKQKRRKLHSDEWFRMSHELAEELMKENAKDDNEFGRWEEFYIDILSEHPTKQGQDILPVVIPVSMHKQVVDKIRIKVVQL